MSTPVVNLTNTPHEEALVRARDALRGGGIVAFPTETVYGLGIRGDNEEVRRRLYELKGRNPALHLARYLSRPEEAELPNLRARVLARRFWPGPLTLVVEERDGSTRGFRLSSHPLAAAMGRDAGFEVYGTSANLSGQPPLTNATAIQETFPEGLALILDEGKSLEGLATTVVQIPRSGGLKLLRQGELDTHALRAAMHLHIAVVCTGNTCRSPLAAVMLQDMLDQREKETEFPWTCRVTSFGTDAFPGLPASEHSQAIAREMGLDLSDHLSSTLNARTLQGCDLILVMTRRHRDVLVALMPDWADRIQSVSVEGGDILDPFGGDLEAYRACAQDMKEHLSRKLEDL